jgi:hypothetical protein
MNAGIGEYAMRRSTVIKPKGNAQCRTGEATIEVEIRRDQMRRHGTSIEGCCSIQLPEHGTQPSLSMSKSIPQFLL